ncbi:MAG: hypothetical protein U0Q16_00930 [Bryobacteraceae bacterium]
MKRFKFPLDRVRQYRKLQLETEQARLERVTAELRPIERMEAELRRQTEEAASEVRAQERTSAVVEPGQVATFSGFRSHVDRVNRKLAAHKQEILARIERQRRAVVETRQRHETLERGRDRALERWREDFAREQDATAAELYLARTARRREKAN